MWKRHTLVDISDAGRKSLLATMMSEECDRRISFRQASELLLPEFAGARIPGIVRRADVVLPADAVAVGFSGLCVGPAGRPRLAATIDIANIVNVLSPYALMALPISGRTRSLWALQAAEELSKRLGLRLGVWGSAALEVCTGLPYTHQESDLDLLVAPASLDVLMNFLEDIYSLEKRFSVRIDVELDLADGYGVQLKELMGSGRMILGKSLADVALLSREHICSQLPESSDMVGHPERFCDAKLNF